MKKLKIIADWSYGERPETAVTRYEDVLPEDRDNNSWWYLHGQLSERVHYDKGTIINTREYGCAKETIGWEELDGNQVKSIHSPGPYYEMYLNAADVLVEVEGIEEPCIGFFWTTEEHSIWYNGKEYPNWKQRGLVCLESDLKSIEYARNKYERKESRL
ncbi:MAG: hypothetical protein J6I84_04125 [Bacilli bacterium]|nr:hypothetical protein [Bacilli bacterium]